MTAICVERGMFSDKEWKREAEGGEDENAAEEESEPLFSVGQKVKNVWPLNCDILPELFQNFCMKEILLCLIRSYKWTNQISIVGASSQ